MQHRLAIDPSHRLAYVQLIGRVNTRHLLEMTMYVLQHPDWEPGYNELWDGLRVTETQIDLEEIRAALEVDKDFEDQVGNGRVAAVVGRGLDHTIGKLYQGMARKLSARQYEVFWTMDGALEWLGLNELPPVLAAIREE